MHAPHLIAEVRDLPPKDGWARHENTGRACLVCPCGTNTGFIDKDQAATQYRDHAEANPPAVLAMPHDDYYQGAHALPALPGTSAYRQHIHGLT